MRGRNVVTLTTLFVGLEFPEIGFMFGFVFFFSVVDSSTRYEKPRAVRDGRGPAYAYSLGSPFVVAYGPFHRLQPPKVHIVPMCSANGRSLLGLLRLGGGADGSARSCLLMPLRVSRTLRPDVQVPGLPDGRLMVSGGLSVSGRPQASL